MTKNIIIFVFVNYLALVSKSSFGFVLPPPPETELTLKYAKELSYFDVPADSLPDGCFKVTEFRTAPLMPMSSNPHITDDEEYINLFLRHADKAITVSAMISSLYADRYIGREIGMKGFILGSSTQIKYMKVKKNSLYKDSLVVGLWLDSKESEPCRQAIKEHLINNGFNTIE